MRMTGPGPLKLLEACPLQSVHECFECYSGIAFCQAFSGEPAGVSFHEKCKKALGILNEECSTEEDTGSDEAFDLDEDERLRAAWKKKKEGGDSSSELDEDEDFYELLDIGHLGFSASAAQIKKAYQKAVLIHHPDKLSPKERERQDILHKEQNIIPRFLKIQKAFHVLGDVNRRRGYDSQHDFDDSIPSAADADERFYEVFGPCFERNGRFSVRKPVPRLGDDDTPFKKVVQFYNFWQRFETWRDFSKFDEFKDGDVESAGSRYEKRWMMRQNESQRAKRKNKEYERISKLVSLAIDKDPRMRRAREQEKLEKKKMYEKKQAESVAKKLAQEEERKRREQEEEQRKQQEEIARRELQRAKAEAKKEFKRGIRCLRKCVSSSSQLLSLPEKKVEELMTGLDIILNAGFGSQDIAPCIRLFKVSDDSFVVEEEENGLNGLNCLQQVIDRARQRVLEIENEKQERLEELRKQQALKEKERIQNKQDKTPWSQEELAYLAKGVRNFPPGHRNRWTMIANYVNTLPSIREPRTPEQCTKRAIALSTSHADRLSMGTSDAAFRLHQQKLLRKAEAASGNQSRGASNQSEPKVDGTVENDMWSQEQQSALEAALAKYPATMDKNERWKAIASAVPGKKKRDCVERFKTIRQKLVNKRNK